MSSHSHCTSPHLDQRTPVPFLFPELYPDRLLCHFYTLHLFTPHHLDSKTEWIKVFIIAVSAILFFIMTTALSDFHNFLDEQGLQTLVEHLNVNAQTRLMNYMKSEMIFFGVGAIISGLILPFRMLISLWRVRNRGTV